MSSNKKSSSKASIQSQDKRAKTNNAQSTAKQHFVRGVLTRGEAVEKEVDSTNKALPPGVTHEITGEDENGQIEIKRRRFSAY